MRRGWGSDYACGCTIGRKTGKIDWTSVEAILYGPEGSGEIERKEQEGADGRGRVNATTAF